MPNEAQWSTMQSLVCRDGVPMNAANQRQILLQQRFEALGLKVWYPRQAMPGSRIHPTEIVAPLAPSEPPISNPVMPAHELQADHQATAKPRPVEGHTERPTSVSLAQDSEVIRQTPLGVEFVQQWWFHEGLLLLDTRPIDADSRDIAEADQLLSALLQVCTQVHRPTLQWHIDWPLFEHRGIKHDWAEAQFYIQQRWQALLKQHHVERVLLLGVETRGLLGFSEGDLPQAQRWIETLSSVQLMRSAAAKQSLWRALQSWLSEADTP